MTPPSKSGTSPAIAVRTAPHAAPTARVDLGLAFGRYTLALPRDARARLALGWLALGIAALAASGVLAVLLVLSRTPGLARLFPVADFFHAALVAHVDLSVLVWFLAFSGVLWSLNSTPRLLPIGWAALALAALGTATIAVSPFAGGTPIMANYVPVIDAPTFLAGIGLFGLGITLLVGRGLFASPLVGMRLDGAGALRFGLNGAIVTTAVAVLAFALVLRGGAGNARRQGLLRIAVLGRRPRAAVHVDAAAAGRVAAARRRDRRARAALAAHRRPAVRHRARRRVRHAADLPRLRRDVGRASPAADVADALRRRTRDRAGRRRGDLGARPARRAFARRPTRRSGRSSPRSSRRSRCSAPAGSSASPFTAAT